MDRIESNFMRHINETGTNTTNRENVREYNK